MTWLVDGPKRRVSNDELGISLVEGKGRDGDIEFSLLDASGQSVAQFFARSDNRDEAHNQLAPPGTNYAIVVSVFNLSGLREGCEIAVNGAPMPQHDVVMTIGNALSRAVAFYDLGFPKYVRVDFLDAWLPPQSQTRFLPA